MDSLSRGAGLLAEPNARTSSSNSADTGRWSLIVMVAWLEYDRCFTVTASDAR